MAAESMVAAAAPPPATGPSPKKRKLNQRKKKPNKKFRPVAKPKNPSEKMKKLFNKRAKAYNSDDEEEEDEEENSEDESMHQSSDDENEEHNQRDGSNLGVAKFSDGCKAFRTALMKIMKKHLPNDPLGPILSAHKKLVAEKLLEEETEHKAKGEAKKEKHFAGEKGHVKPAGFLDTKERLLISVATKGVVKLFNAVNKAQNPQKGLNPSRSKDVKEAAKQRKQTFLSELNKSTIETPAFHSSKVIKSSNEENDDEPGWAPLRDSFMLTNSKLKDWDKMPEPAAGVEGGSVPFESSSDED